MTNSRHLGNAHKPLIAALCGFLFGAFSYTGAAGLVMLTVPRRPDGVRQVVDLPWPAYATLPCLISASILIILLFLPLPNSTSRLTMLVAAGIAIAISTLLTIDLLRRDHIGKL